MADEMTIATLVADNKWLRAERNKLYCELDDARKQLAALTERQPLSHGTRPLTERLHDKPLLVSWDPDSKCMVVSTMSDFFTHGVATATSLWDLLVEFHDHPQMVAERETGRKAAGRIFQQAPSKEEQDQWLAEHKPKDTTFNLSLDDLDLEI